MDFLSMCKLLAQKMEAVPTHWDGREAILEMKAAGSSQWRQMEWMGFYFEFLCAKHLKGLMTIPGTRYGKTGFDGFWEVPWDFKAHAINTSSHEIVVNDREAIEKALKDFGAVGLMVALGKVEYNDEDRTFKMWHDTLKESKSIYVTKKESEGAWSRLRKQSVELVQISYIEITQKTLSKAGSFQRGFKNSNDNPRREKVSLDLEKLERELIFVQNFQVMPK